MGALLKLAAKGVKHGANAHKVNPGDPLFVDTVNVAVKVGKHLIDFIF